MSESLEPEQVVDILNEYLELTTNSIFKNGGTLDKFIGDATMAVFNATDNTDSSRTKGSRRNPTTNPSHPNIRDTYKYWSS